ncbi:hypothetical protein BGZ67_001361, partial [Mortierella alpina]
RVQHHRRQCHRGHCPDRCRVSVCILWSQVLQDHALPRRVLYLLYSCLARPRTPRTQAGLWIQCRLDLSGRGRSRWSDRRLSLSLLLAPWIRCHRRCRWIRPCNVHPLLDKRRRHLVRHGSYYFHRGLRSRGHCADILRGTTYRDPGNGSCGGRCLL